MERKQKPAETLVLQDTNEEFLKDLINNDDLVQLCDIHDIDEEFSLSKIDMTDLDLDNNETGAISKTDSENSGGIPLTKGENVDYSISIDLTDLDVEFDQLEAKTMNDNCAVILPEKEKDTDIYVNTHLYD